MNRNRKYIMEVDIKDSLPGSKGPNRSLKSDVFD